MHTSPAAIDPGFATAAMTQVFSAHARVARLLEFEAQLALAQSELGLVPVESAEAIAAACAQEVDDPAGLLARGWEAGTPVAPLLTLLRARLAREHTGFVHHGATTQDAVDTACALQLRDALTLLEADTVNIAAHLRRLCDAHRQTPICGRTLLQKALPSSFGLTAAHWLAPLVPAARALTVARLALPVQLGGPVGALDGLERRGVALTEALAGRLGLAVPLVPWHGDRAPLMEAVHATTRLVRAGLKIANDLVLLAQSDVGELRMRAGGSSSMPHKQNPIDAVRAIAAAEGCLRLAAGLSTGRAHELERAAGGWHMEWLFLPLVFYTAGAALEALEAALGSLQIDDARMRAGADGSAAPCSAEALIDRVLAEAAAQWKGNTP